jgi:hypothetical protein
MKYYILLIATVLLGACNSSNPRGGKTTIPNHLPQTIRDTFYYEGVMKYSAIDQEKHFDSTRKEITKVYITGSDKLFFGFVMINYLPFLVDLGNPADTIMTAAVDATFDIADNMTFRGKTKNKNRFSLLQFLKNDSLIFEEDWNFSEDRHHEHWTFIGKRIR